MNNNTSNLTNQKSESDISVINKDAIKQSKNPSKNQKTAFRKKGMQKQFLYPKGGTKKTNEYQTGYYTFTRKTQYDGYSLCNDYNNQSRQLVLFTSAESDKVFFFPVILHFRDYRMLSIIIFKCTLFSKSISISQELCFQLVLR